MPTPYKNGDSFEIKMWNVNGTITTPWFGEDFVEEYYKEDREFHFVLELPIDIKDQVGSGLLVLELEFNTRMEEGWIEEVVYSKLTAKDFTLFQKKLYTYHTSHKSWTQAEAECQREGGHLASVLSEEVNEKVKNESRTRFFWLGGRKEFKKWSWSDGSDWTFTKWEKGFPTDAENRCVLSNGKWQEKPCDYLNRGCQKYQLSKINMRPI